MGDDPHRSVVNRYNRAHDLENLYIVDASFFPSGSGINPSLTIAANAIRVGRHLLEKQKKPSQAPIRA
jgi:choline dehydrogenase-like flavoprotein